MDLKKEGDRRGGGVEKLRSGERVIRSDTEGREVVNHYLNYRVLAIKPVI